jgi:DnaJ-class molecular chaperone
MRIPFTRKAIGCPTCGGTGEVLATDFTMGKGKTLVTKRCHSCGGRRTLRRR